MIRPDSRLERGAPDDLLKLTQMGTQGVHMKGVLPWLVLWARLPVQKIFILPWLLQLAAQYKICFLHRVHYLNHLSPSPSMLGRQSCRVSCLLICVFGLDHLYLSLIVCVRKSWNKEDNMERTWIQTVTLS